MFTNHKEQINTIREKIKKASAETSLVKVSYESDVNFHTIYRFILGKKPSLDTLEKLEIWLNNKESNGK